jgi:hypothetical protein
MIINRNRFTEFYSLTLGVLFPKLISYRLSSKLGAPNQTLYVFVRLSVMTNIVTLTSSFVGMRLLAVKMGQTLLMGLQGGC